jgi:hypothetical protein
MTKSKLHFDLLIWNYALDKEKTKPMASGSTPTKATLEGQIDQAIGILEDAYTPESSREDLAEAIGQALDVLRSDEEDEDESDEEDDDLGE